MDELVTNEVLVWAFRKPVSVVFEPKEDITAYELAKCLYVFHGQTYFVDEWDSLGSWTRHFRRTDI